MKRLSDVLATGQDTMPHGPVSFLFELAEQVHLLSCLSWVGTTQVLACIPPDDEVTFEDIVETTGVPIMKLTSVVRRLAAADFLHEPRHAFVAHTPLSLQYFEQPSLMDATLFLFNKIASGDLRINEAAGLDLFQYSPPLESGPHFGLHGSASQQQSRQRRQMDAFRSLSLTKLDSSVVEALLSLDWKSLGEATVVHVGPPSRAITLPLLKRAPQLKTVIQWERQTSQASSEERSEGRIRIQHYADRGRQTIIDADVYILYLPGFFVNSTSSSSKAKFSSSLKAHFDLLRKNDKASLLVLALVRPDGDMPAGMGSVPSVHDAIMLELTEEDAMSSAELERLIQSIGDDHGSLVVANKRSPSLAHRSIAIMETRIQQKTGVLIGIN